MAEEELFIEEMRKGIDYRYFSNIISPTQSDGNVNPLNYQHTLSANLETLNEKVISQGQQAFTDSLLSFNQVRFLIMSDIIELFTACYNYEKSENGFSKDIYNKTEAVNDSLSKLEGIEQVITDFLFQKDFESAQRVQTYSIGAINSITLFLSNSFHINIEDSPFEGMFEKILKALRETSALFSSQQNDGLNKRKELAFLDHLPNYATYLFATGEIWDLLETHESASAVARHLKKLSLRPYITQSRGNNSKDFKNIFANRKRMK
jgi:hypothetical protein